MPPDLSAAVEILDAMEASGAAEPTPEEFLALDAQFHYALAEAAGNEVIAAMMTGLRNSIESYAIAGLPNLASWRETSARLRREHRAIVAAIRSADATDARRVVDDHITGYYAEAGFGTPPRAAVAASRAFAFPSTQDGPPGIHASTSPRISSVADPTPKGPHHG
ncbi:hypothetical protein B7R25_01000 [Subtercola boreus]|uniref:GntR C-terminal domain-containing protein n=1 Tax=Subtercola boreus TaxID=120213 RepID=A0A3E0WHH0_9MICO|nr:hypothetical protein B7R24_01005 [Subtercola boreus]RFA24095.1 hypothetical protein B7R23_01005 [Subtercola boreus]RFA29796.1 hypothetical protein B7R25_01000 [Subtercola boreus]